MCRLWSVREALVVLELVLFGPGCEEEVTHFFLRGGEALSQNFDRIAEGLETFGSDLEDGGRAFSDVGKRYREYGMKCGEVERRAGRCV